MAIPGPVEVCSAAVVVMAAGRGWTFCIQTDRPGAGAPASTQRLPQRSLCLRAAAVYNGGAAAGGRADDALAGWSMREARRRQEDLFG